MLHDTHSFWLHILHTHLWCEYKNQKVQHLLPALTIYIADDKEYLERTPAYVLSILFTLNLHWVPFRSSKFKCPSPFTSHLSNASIITFFRFWDIFGLNLLRNSEKSMVLFSSMSKDRNRTLRSLSFSCKPYTLVPFLSSSLVNLLEKSMSIFLKTTARSFIPPHPRDKHLLRKISNNSLARSAISFFQLQYIASAKFYIYTACEEFKGYLCLHISVFFLRVPPMSINVQFQITQIKLRKSRKNKHLSSQRIEFFHNVISK